VGGIKKDDSLPLARTSASRKGCSPREGGKEGNAESPEKTKARHRRGRIEKKASARLERGRREETTAVPSPSGKKSEYRIQEERGGSVGGREGKKTVNGGHGIATILEESVNATHP